MATQSKTRRCRSCRISIRQSRQNMEVDANGENHKLLQFTDNDEVVMFLPDGQTTEVELSQAGVLAFNQVANNYAYYATR
jgi:hypothetical protein